MVELGLDWGDIYAEWLRKGETWILLVLISADLWLLILLMLTTVNFEFVRCVRSSLACAVRGVVSTDLSLAVVDWIGSEMI